MARMKGVSKVAKLHAQSILDKSLLDGEKELRRRLLTLEHKTAIKIAIKGSRKGVQFLAKEIKKEIPSRFKQARKGIGWKAKRATKKTHAISKAGVAVGKKKTNLQALQAELANMRGKSRGVGIGPANFHWWILGTDQRFTKKGHPTGKMPARMPGLARQVAARSQQGVKIAILRELRKQLFAEVKKMTK